MSDVLGRLVETTYCTLFRIGYGASLDAKCEARVDPDYDYITSYSVHFVLIGRAGGTVTMGYSIISQYLSERPEMHDEDGDEFPNLDAAIRAHADRLMATTPMPGCRVPNPPRRDLWNGSVGVAFVD